MKFNFGKVRLNAILLLALVQNLASAQVIQPGKPIFTKKASCTLTYSCNQSATHAAYCWRQHDQYCVDSQSTYVGASNAVNCTIALPSGYVIDTAKLSGGTGTSNQKATYLGSGQWQDAGTAFKYLQVMYASTTSVVLNENPGVLQGSSLANNDSIKVNFCVPISGW